MKEREIQKENLVEYTLRKATIDDLWHRIGELEETIDALNSDIENAERSGFTDTVEVMCRNRNDLDLRRIDMTLEVHRLEDKQLEFERIQLLTR